MNKRGASEVFDYVGEILIGILVISVFLTAINAHSSNEQNNLQTYADNLVFAVNRLVESDNEIVISVQKPMEFDKIKINANSLNSNTIELLATKEGKPFRVKSKFELSQIKYQIKIEDKGDIFVITKQI